MIDPQKAQDILFMCGLESRHDFHTLSSGEVEHLLEYANAHSYRKPRNANGSRARYWFNYLRRRADKTREGLGPV